MPNNCGIGDEIIEINGESFENLTHQEAVAAIKKHKRAAVCLRLLVARYKTTKSQQRFHSLILPFNNCAFINRRNCTKTAVNTAKF